MKDITLLYLLKKKDALVYNLSSRCEVLLTHEKQYFPTPKSELNTFFPKVSKFNTHPPRIRCNDIDKVVLAVINVKSH